MTCLESQQVSWWPVLEFARTEAALFGVDLTDGLPVPGTPSWCSLRDDDRCKLAAVLLLGAQYALALDARQEAAADASRAIANAADWPQIAREMRQRSAFREAHPWARREVI